MAGQTQKGPAEARYNDLKSDRDPFLTRARECAKLTLPFLIPPDGFTSGDAIKSTYQSIGANGCNNLASKLLLTMLPPNEPCFRLRVDNMLFEKQQAEIDPEWKSKIDKALSRCEQTVLGDIESTGDRVIVYEGNLHLLVGGNVLYYDDKEQGLRMFPLSRYVVVRDPMGRVVEIVVHETVNPSTLPEGFLEGLSSITGKANGDVAPGKDSEVDIYTHVIRTPKKWKVYQECRGKTIPGTLGYYQLDSCPWIPVRMYQVAGESYGRSYVEPFLGDLISVESLMQAVVEGSAAAAKILLFVAPNGTTSMRAVAEAGNGDVLEGNAEEVSVLQLQKHADFRIALETLQMISDRLKTSFLMTDGMRRDAERVTAEEIRAVARELESALGGVYTMISQEFQLPFIQHRIAKLTKAKLLPPLPKGVVKPTVITGFDALGRGNDKAKLMELLQAAKELLGPEMFAKKINTDDALSRLASAIGINIEGLLVPQEALAQQSQQAQTMGMVEKLGPEVIKQIGPAMMGQAQPQPATPTPQG